MSVLPRLPHALRNLLARLSGILLSQSLAFLIALLYLIATPALAADVSIAVATGWNLTGNSTTTAIDVASVLGDKTKVTTVWKWDSANSAWAFYSPVFASATDLSNYASGKGYQVLVTIAPGQGFWVNAASPFTFTLTAVTLYNLGASDLINGWNLVSTGNNVTPSVFNISLSSTQPAPGVVPISTQPAPGVVPINLTTLWAWDSAAANWYFYAPSLEAKGGTALADYIASKGYLDFVQANKTLGNDVGFWVNMAASTTGVPLVWDLGTWNNVDWQ